jgi:hypothetical protein
MSTAPLPNPEGRGYGHVGDKSPKNNDKKRRQQTKAASKEKAAAKK